MFGTGVDEQSDEEEEPYLCGCLASRCTLCGCDEAGDAEEERASSRRAARLIAQGRVMPLIKEFVADYLPTHEGAAIEVLVEELACRWGLKPDKLWDVEVPPGVLEGGLTIAKALSATRAEWLRQKQLAEQAASRRLYLASRQLYQYNYKESQSGAHICLQKDECLDDC